MRELHDVPGNSNFSYGAVLFLLLLFCYAFAALWICCMTLKLQKARKQAEATTPRHKLDAFPQPLIENYATGPPTPTPLDCAFFLSASAGCKIFLPPPRQGVWDCRVFKRGRVRLEGLGLGRRFEGCRVVGFREQGLGVEVHRPSSREDLSLRVGVDWSFPEHSASRGMHSAEKIDVQRHTRVVK